MRNRSELQVDRAIASKRQSQKDLVDLDGMELAERKDMPANNFLLRFSKAEAA